MEPRELTKRELLELLGGYCHIRILGMEKSKISHVQCPQCYKEFVLSWNSYLGKPETLLVRDCPSGGVYDVRIRCCHCDYEEEL